MINDPNTVTIDVEQIIDYVGPAPAGYAYTGKTKVTPDGENVYQITRTHEHKGYLNPGIWGTDANDSGWIARPENIVQLGMGGYLDPDVMVYGRARLSGEPVLRDQARVFDSARVEGGVISGQARVAGNAVVMHSHVSGGARVAGSAVVRNSEVRDDAFIASYARPPLNSRILGKARVYEAHDVLTASVRTILDMTFTLSRQVGKGAHVSCGCWAGSLEEFAAMIDSDEWVDTRGEAIEKYRPEMEAVVALAQARAARWAADTDPRYS